MPASDGAAQHQNPSLPKPPVLRQSLEEDPVKSDIFASFRGLHFVAQLFGLESFYLGNKNVCEVLRDDWQTALKDACTILGVDAADDASVAKVAEALLANLVAELKLDQSATRLYKKFYGNDASVAGMLAALRLLETTGMRQTMPEVVADAVLYLSAPDKRIVTQKGQQLMRVRDNFLADREDKKVKALNPYTGAIYKRLLCLLPDEVHQAYRKLASDEQLQFLLVLPTRIRTDFPDIAASAQAPDLDELLSRIHYKRLLCLKKIEVIQATEDAFNKTLITQLVALLPEHVRQPYQALESALSTSALEGHGDAGPKEALKILLRTSHTSPTDLCQRLKSRDEVFEALQITWAAPALFCMRFAHELRDLLSVHQDPALFLNAVRSHLTERLALNAQLAAALQVLSSTADAHDVATVMAGLSADMQRVLVRRKKVADPPTTDDGLHNSAADHSVAASEKQAADRFSEVVRWLRAQQLSARAT